MMLNSKINKIFNFDDDDYDAVRPQTSSKRKIKENAKKLAYILMTKRGQHHFHSLVNEIKQRVTVDPSVAGRMLGKAIRNQSYQNQRHY